MQLIFGLAVASLLKATTALVSNGTTETVFITQTAWSTVFSCPAPQTVTVCNAQCTSPSPMPVNNANIIYQTVSDCQAGQVLTIDGTQTTLAQATTLTLENTIADLVLNPASVTINDYTARAALTEVVYPSYTGNSGEVVTCQTGITTISGDNVVLSNCPCTVQSTVLEITATAAGAVPSAVVSSSYIVKIIYIYEVEVIVEQVPTTITTTATEVLTTVQTTTQTGTVTTTASSRPTIVTVDRVTFLLRYDTTFDGVAVSGLRKRQTIGSPLVSTALNACLAQCAGQGDCRAASFMEDTSLCTTLIQYDAQSLRDSAGEIFAIVILRPSTPTNSGSSTNSAAPSNSGSSTRMASSTMSRSSTQSAIVSTTSSSSKLSTSFGDSTTGSDSTSSGPVSRSGSSSAPYPISNTSVSSTSLRVRSSSSSSSSVSVSITGSSDIPMTSQSSSSEISSSISSSTPTGSSSNPSTSSSLTNSSLSSQIITSSSSLSSSVVLPVTNTSSISLPAVNTSVTSSASSTPVTPLTGCAVASDILDYLPAMSYCCSAYPVTTYTRLFDATTTNIVTATAQNLTFYENITLPTQTTIQTDQETTTEIDVTLALSTVINTVTTTTTTTSTPGVVATTFVARRQAMPSVQASIFSSVLSRPASDVALVCSCLQTPTTMSMTSTQTILSTTIVTPVVDATNYFTPPVVTIETTETITTTTLDVSTSETTITSTALATATVPPYPQCDPTQAYGGAGGQGGCSSNCFCNADVDQVHAYCGSDCGADQCSIECTSDSDCPSGEFCDTFDFGGSGTCYAVLDCTSTYTPRKKRFVLGPVDTHLVERSDGFNGTDLNRPWLVDN